MSKMDSVSTKRTVTTYESNNYDDYEAKTRPTIQKRNLVIRRDAGGGGGSTMSMQRSTHYSSTGSGPGSLAL